MKENITIEDSIGEYKEYYEKICKLKEKVEKEMIKLDDLYSQVDKDLSKSFEEKHLALTKQEGIIRDKMQNEVTKIKEKLEKYLSQFNMLIKSCEKINKGIKVFDKEEKQMIRILSYVSKINKNKKEMKALLVEKMKNLKIEYIKEENNIKYSEYYFNGIKNFIKNIEFKEISLDKFKITWNRDEQNKIDNSNENIIYIVEIRKDNINEKFEKKYEGKQCNCLINNLEPDTTYEIKISVIYNNSICEEGEIKKIKTKEVDSIILNETKKPKVLLNKIYEFSKYKKFELLYRGTRDGMNSYAFHQKCDNKGPTICLYKNNKNHIFGGYAAISWTNSGEWKPATNSFLFTLTNMHNTEPMKLPHSEKDKIYSVYHHPEYGPSFGSGRDISISTDFIFGESYANFPYTYVDITGKKFSIFSSDLNSNKFKLKEIEVFSVN